MWQRDQAVSIFVRSGRFWIEFPTLQGKPKSHAWNTKGSFRSNRLPFIPTRGQVHHKRLQDHMHYQSAGHMSVARLQNLYSWLPLQHVFPHIESSNQKNQIHVVGGMSTPRADWLLGLLLTQNSRHVISTFKRLTPITTHCDLIKTFNNTDGVSFPSKIPHITPSVILIVVTGM
jgi:hypothetical protein